MNKLNCVQLILSDSADDDESKRSCGRCVVS